MIDSDYYYLNKERDKCIYCGEEIYFYNRQLHENRRCLPKNRKGERVAVEKPKEKIKALYKESKCENCGNTILGWNRGYHEKKGCADLINNWRSLDCWDSDIEDIIDKIACDSFGYNPELRRKFVLDVLRELEVYLEEED